MYISCSCSFMLAFSKKYRSIQRRFLLKKVKSCKFHGKTLALEPLFNKVAGLQAYNFIKRRVRHSCFPVKFVKLLRTPILNNISERLLLGIVFAISHSIPSSTEFTKLETGIPWLQSFNHFNLKQ